MNFPFDPDDGCILVDCKLRGPKASIDLKMNLDTGASFTAISKDQLLAAGYDPDNAVTTIRLITASGPEICPVLVVNLSALGVTERDHIIVSHTLPMQVGLDGLLGLNFFNGKTLSLDLRKKAIELT